MPPPAEGFTARLVLGPALRTQPDRRLVALVRDGYELAFEEIVRRYGKPLAHYAAAIVGSRGEDVTQDAFSKALLALRRDGTEIELRPWLFRIVRNTALNELRDNPPSPEVLAEAIAGGRNPAEEIERREELTDLMQRLQSLPEPQRAAIVMRELEGLGHEEIAAALGLSGGGARQAIYRARQALREGAGMLLPLPLLRLLIDHGSDATAAGAGAGGAAAASGAMGGAGAGIALKAGVVTAVLAGSVGTGIALHDRGHRDADAAAATTPNAVTRALSDSAPTTAGESPNPQSAAEHDDQGRSNHRGPGNGSSDDSGHGPGGDRNDQLTSGRSFASDDDGPSPEAGGHHGQRGAEEGDEPHGGRGGGRGEDGGSSPSGSGGGSGGGGPSESRGGGQGGGGGEGGGGGSGSSGSGRGRDDSEGGDSGPAEPAPPPPPPAESVPGGDGGSSSDSGLNSSGSGSGPGSSDDGQHGGEEIP
jgi:RNA polymerase sigma factor (sigma-70 family)